MISQTITAYITPSATLTSWITASTALTSGVSTVTVGAAGGTDRLINGDFQTGDLSGWELDPPSLTGSISSTNYVPSGQGFSYRVGSSTSGALRQVLPIYLEAGQYRVGVTTSLSLFPQVTDYWGSSLVFQFFNPATATNTTVNMPHSVKIIVNKQLVIQFQQSFTVSDSAAGYNQLSIWFPIGGGTMDGIFLTKSS